MAHTDGKDRGEGGDDEKMVTVRTLSFWWGEREGVVG